MRKLYLFILIFSQLFLYISPVRAHAAEIGKWTYTQTPLFPHDVTTVTEIENNKVLVAGYEHNAEIYDISTRSWINVNGSLKDLHYGHTATLLDNGEVLIVGLGNNATSVDSQYGELFNPFNNSWKSTDNLINPKRIDFSTTKLMDGRVLVIGGGFAYDTQSYNDVEVYNPVTNNWSFVSPMNMPRNLHSSTLLKNGNVFVAGGGSMDTQGFSPQNSTEIYDPNLNIWSNSANMNFSRSGHTATLLPNGKVLIVGGFEKLQHNIYNPPLASAEIYDPSTNKMNLAANMNTARALHTATLINGKVLIAGGVGNDGSKSLTLTSTEIYDPNLNTWTQVAPMNVARYYHASELLSDGTILTVGGANDNTIDQGNAGKSAEIFNINDITITTPTPTSTPPIINVDYKQTDSRWGNERISKSNSCATMYNEGCAITAAADVFAAYGKNVLADNSSLNPGNLNNWLAFNGGFSGCAIRWGVASSKLQLGAPVVAFRNNNTSWLGGQQMIDLAIQNGNVPIVGINTIFGTHFIALKDKLSDVNGKPDYSIVDPALYPFKQNDLGKTGKSLSQAYGGFDKVFEVVNYKKDSSSQSSLAIRVHSPVELLITDPNGNQTGYDTTTKNIKEDIPQSTYGVEPGIGPVDGSAPQAEDTKYFQVNDPVEGNYTINVIGTGDGTYTLDFSQTDPQGNASAKVISGYAQEGVAQLYDINYIVDATQPPKVTKEVSFDVLKSDIKTLYSQKQIKTKAVYQILLAQAIVAENLNSINKQPLANKLSIAALKTIQLTLKTFHGKELTEDAYQILSADVASLILMIQGDSGGNSGGGT